ncbi:MAG: 23S rRNA (pseudouridine(1915)-N(3))-methyltransferase RlmH [Defluviitaleaceae bacterium]|nr:23S rRNA (pseudouridine(1915)-N(3))-methyltransferase RlmH [Defluviitaleaceae bacterium]
MNITVLCIGKLKEEYFRAAAAEYIKRLSGYCAVRVVEVPDEKIPDRASPAEEDKIKQKETAALLEKIARRDFVIVLDLSGKPLDSPAFSELLSRQAANGASGFTFVIGGSLGLAPAMLERADYTLSASRMTFPHQLIRVILLEQIYRAFKIARGGTYHK